MLSFICGTPGSGKSREIFRRAETDAKNGKNVFILVPEQYSMYMEHELLTRLGLEAQNKIQILTFARLCNLVFSRKGPLRLKYIDNAGKYMLARKAIREIEDEFSLLRPNVHQHGFAKLAVSAVSEFKRYGISPQRLREAAEGTDDVRLSSKLCDLSAIYERFNRITAEKYSNSEDNLTLVLPKLSECDFFSGTVYISFFRSFTPSEYDIIGELMKKADICCALCTDTVSDDSSVFLPQVHTYTRLCRIAEETGTKTAEVQFLHGNGRFENSPELLHLRDSYFAAKPQPMHGEVKSIHIYRPNNYYDEVVQCARLIIRLCRTQGCSFNDFLVITGSLENYESTIPAVFEEFGIKFFLDRKMCMSESPFMRMLLSVVEILSYGFSYSRVMTVMRSGFFPVTAGETDMFENYILAAGISHRHWNSREKWSFNPDPRLFDLDAVNSVKERVSDRILNLADMFHGRKTVSDICTNIYKWLSALGMADTVKEKIESFRSMLMYENAEQLRLVWNSFVAVTNQLTDCMGGEYATFTEFYEILTSACSELSVGIVPPTQDKVIISEAERFRSTGVRTVIVLGVNDGVFPRGGCSDGLISDAERVLLAENGLELAPDAYSRQLEGRFLTYSVLTTATEQLFLFSPLGDREGKSLSGSEIIRRIQDKLFPNIKIHCHETENAADIIEGREYTFHELSSRIFNSDGLYGIWKSVYDCYRSNPEYSERLKNIEKMRLHTAMPEKISLETAKQLYGDPLILSVSKLERYNSCAFSFFMKYGLLARERLSGAFEANDMGTVLHSVLCDYFREKSRLNADYGSITRDDCRREIVALTDAAAGRDHEILFDTSAYYRYIILRMKSIAAATAWKLVRFYAQSSFRPSGFEVSIGRRGSIPACELDTGDGKAYLEGFIDRLDSAEINGKLYIAITDYKSSEKKLDFRLTEAGVSFQPLMYANMVCAASENTAPAALLYMQMNDPILKFDDVPDSTQLEKGISDSIKTNGIVLNDPDVLRSLDADFGDKGAVHYIPCDSKSVLQKADLDARLENAQKKAQETASEIIGGGISVNPVKLSGFDPCIFCPYSEICGEQHS